MKNMHFPSGEPAAVELRAGASYRYCRCGSSKTKPWCDNSHPVGVTPLEFIATRDEIVWLCTCNRTAKPPFCDGTHAE